MTWHAEVITAEPVILRYDESGVVTSWQFDRRRIPLLLVGSLSLSKENQMEQSPALTPDDVRRELQKLDDWSNQDNRLTKSFTLHDFQDAISFVVQVAIAAEKINHHPDISISYNKVHFSCCTHDAGHRLTQLDFSLASRISQLAQRFLKMGK